MTLAVTERSLSGQQRHIQRIAPIWSVAAITPNISAAGTLRFLPGMITVVRFLSRSGFASLAVLAVVSCAETTSPPATISILGDDGQRDWQSVSVGGDHSCAIKSNGNAYCWGSNRYGELGVAAFDTTCESGKIRYRCSMIPLQVQPGVKFASISAGARHSCAITVAREAYCWGANDQNQVGDFSFGGARLARVPGALPWAQVSAGATHSCAVRTDGAVFCWGANDRGQLGNASLGAGQSIVRVPLPAPAASVSAGQQRTCVRTTIGTVYCWGAVWTHREAGLEYSRTQSSPQAVPGAPAMTYLSVGTFTTCGSDASGFAYCWEANPRGQMGTGNQNGSITPMRVASDLEFVQVTSGIVQTCGIVTSGAGYCWGDDSFGQIGVPPSSLIERCGGQQLPCSTKPIPVFGQQLFVDISTGFGSHTCGVTTRGNLYCWGLGVSGQRGDASVALAVSIPILVTEPVVR